jgi:hypothetical protein
VNVGAAAVVSAVTAYAKINAHGNGSSAPQQVSLNEQFESLSLPGGMDAHALRLMRVVWRLRQWSLSRAGGFHARSELVMQITSDALGILSEPLALWHTRRFFPRCKGWPSAGNWRSRLVEAVLIKRTL